MSLHLYNEKVGEIVKNNFDKFKEAEDNNLSSFSFAHGEGSYYVKSLQNKIGQIIEWRTESSIFPIKKVWKFVKMDEITVTFEIVDKDRHYHSLKQTILSYRDIQNVSDEEFGSKLKIKSLVISDKGVLGEIVDIKIEEVEDKKLSRDNEINNPHRDTIYKDEIQVLVKQEKIGNRFKSFSLEDEPTKFSLEEFKSNFTILKETTFEQFLTRITQIENTQSLIGFEDKILLENDITNVNSIISFNSQDQLKISKQKYQAREDEANSLAIGLSRQIAIKKEEIDQAVAIQKAKIELVLRKANEIVAIVKEEIGKIDTLITTLEIYSGVCENIKQIKVGERVSSDVPITIRQQVLYMDEEVAITDNEGIDFSTIELFDEWLAGSEKAVNRLLPEEKGVVLLRPRRFMKEREGIHPMLKNEMEKLDKRCYVLIRNGENLYRIWTSNIEVQDALIPSRVLLQDLLDKLFEEEKTKAQNQKDSYEYKNADTKAREIENHLLYYKRILILIQGLIVRTEIFTPVQHDLNILDIETHKGRINFVYDGENLLENGRKSFKEWKKDLNSKLVRGSRILFIDELCPSAKSLGVDRFSLKWEHEHSAPDTPKTGVYSPNHYKKEIWTTKMVKITYEQAKKDKEDYDELVKKYTTEELVAGEVKEKTKVPLNELKKFKHSFADGWDLREKRQELYVVKVVKDVRYKKDYRDREELEWEYEREVTYEDVFKISYNPKDTVYAQRQSFSDGSWSRQRRANITMETYKDDRFIINYDALVLDDIEFYLEDRVNRKGYLEMLPILKNLKNEIIKEQKEEKEFVSAMVQRLLSKYQKELVNLQDSTNYLESLIFKKVEWWKNTIVTVWKRPISNNDSKAWLKIEEETLKELKKKFKLNVQILVDNRKKVLLFELITKSKQKYWFFGTGLTKKEFTEKLMTEKEYLMHKNNISKTKLFDSITITENRELVDTANLNLKEIFCKFFE
jgi:hypothetical protein